MAATATTILGTKTLPYVETDRAMGRNLAQTAGHYPALPMIGMGLMLVATALIIAVVRADLSVSLRGGFDAGDKAGVRDPGRAAAWVHVPRLRDALRGHQLQHRPHPRRLPCRRRSGAGRRQPRLQDAADAAHGLDLPHRHDDGDDDPHRCPRRPRLRRPPGPRRPGSTRRDRREPSSTWSVAPRPGRPGSKACGASASAST